MKTTGCPICSADVRLWRQKSSGGKAYTIYFCGACAYAFVHPRPSIEELKKMYETSGHGDDAPKETPLEIVERAKKCPGDAADAKRLVGKVETFISPGMPKTLLDLGCGYGSFSQEAMRRGFTVTPLESAQFERETATLLLGFEPMNGWFEDAEFETQFSSVLMSQVLEHAYDVNAWIQKAAEVLRKQGVLCIALPNFNSAVRLFLKEKDPYICPPIHLNFFTSKSLARLLVKHGFSVVHTTNFSRIPLSAIEKRLKIKGSKIGAALHLAVDGGMALFGKIGLGQMINMYALKN